MTFEPGQLVIVTFDGIDHQGEIEKVLSQGWIRCKIRIDPDADYGSQTARLGIESVVCVRESSIRHADPEA